MNKKASLHLWELLKKNTAILLLVLFTGMPVFELVHNHEHDCLSADHHGQQLKKNTAKCKVCDHFTRYQHTAYLAVDPFSVCYFEGDSHTISSLPAEQPVTLCGPGWSNKGPPSSI